MVVMVSVAPGPRACRCPGWRESSAGAGGREMAGQAEPAQQRPQVGPGQAEPGDGGVRAGGDGVERITERQRPGLAAAGRRARR